MCRGDKRTRNFLRFIPGNLQIFLEAGSAKETGRCGIFEKGCEKYDRGRTALPLRWDRFSCPPDNFLVSVRENVGIGRWEAFRRTVAKATLDRCIFREKTAPTFFLPDDLIPGRQLPADAGFLAPAFSVAGGRRYIKQLTGTVALNLLEQLFWKYVFPIQICHASAPFTVSFSVMAVTEHIRTDDPAKCGSFTFRLCCRQCLCIAEPPLYVCMSVIYRGRCRSYYLIF